MPDQSIDLPVKGGLPPEERAEFAAWGERIDRKPDELHARAGRTLVPICITP